MYVYILRCKNNTYYTGITGNLGKRVHEHTMGLSKFTKSRLPVDLVYYETVASRRLARTREVVIKDMSQKKKIELIRKFTSSASEKRG